MKIGGHHRSNGQCEFIVWAPLAQSVAVKLVSASERLISMNRMPGGYWHTTAEQGQDKILYTYRLNSQLDRPDPASHFQPEGVHGPSQVIDHSSFPWKDETWEGVPLSEMIMYELHVGTFTPQGTFEAIIPRLNALNEVGINAIEIMPVAQFPGERNWGYDGVYPFAVQSSYGGPEGLKRLVNACHQQGVAVILDVVYNHLGPEGNYFSDFGPYFTDKYKTPWGSAINYDDVYSDGVRRFFIDNAIHWFREYHIDALRLDAIHAIYDFSAKPFLQELSEQVEEFNSKTGQRRYLIAETDQNDAKVIRPSKEGGYGLHAQWCDDFHHALHSLLTGEKTGYYMDFGGLDHLVRSLRDGYAYSGQYSAYRKRRHGNSSHERPADQFIVFSQNHDHVGNRLKGERLSHLLSLEGQKVVAGLVLLSPYIPLLFMGEEYGEEAPFLYFVHHSDPGLIAAVRKGRREEFRAFGWQQDPPDPQSDQTFLRSKLNWNKRNEGNHGTLFEFYKKLIQMRREIPALSNLDKHSMEVSYSEHDQLILLRRWMDHSQIFCLYNLDQKDHQAAHLLPPGDWTKILDSSDESWKGPGSRLPAIIRGSSFAVYQLKGA